MCIRYCSLLRETRLSFREEMLFTKYAYLIREGIFHLSSMLTVTIVERTRRHDKYTWPDRESS